MNISKEQWQKILSIVLSAALAVFAVLGWVIQVESPEARAIRERISIDAQDDAYLYNGADLYIYSDNHSTQKFHVDGATGAVDAESTANFADAVTIQTGGLTVTAGGLTISDGDAVVADDLRITAQTAITVTNGNAFTPTGTYQPIQAGSEVTPTVTVGTAGDVVVLINTSANAINIADSGTAKLSAAAALGQYDSLTLWCDGTNWIEVSRSNN